MLDGITNETGKNGGDTVLVVVLMAYTGSGVERRGSVVTCRRLESCRRNLVWGRLLYRVWCAVLDGTRLEASAEEFPRP